MPMSRIKSCGLPVIVHLLDDGPEWLGPDAFPAASHALDWARAILCNGTGAQTSYYEAAVERALQIGRLTIVDTGTEHFEDWRRCIIANAPGRPVLAIKTAPEDFHPTDRAP